MQLARIMRTFCGEDDWLIQYAYSEWTSGRDEAEHDCQGDEGDGVQWGQAAGQGVQEERVKRREGDVIQGKEQMVSWIKENYTICGLEQERIKFSMFKYK